jgi:hypothetical protein
VAAGTDFIYQIHLEKTNRGSERGREREREKEETNFFR